jgi:hypothetical protein
MTIDPKQVLATALPHLRSRISERWIEEAIQAMEPFQREGVLLERIWPPRCRTN